MNIDIFYYTGTGNTARAVDVIRKELALKKHPTTAVRIDVSTAVPTSPPRERLIIAFPVYAWMPPVTMQHFLKRFPRGTCPCTVVAVRGGMPKPDDIGGYTGGALEMAERILRRKGYDIVQTADAGYPDNWQQFIAPENERDVSLICGKGDEEIRAIVRKMIDTERSLYRAKPVPKLLTGLVAWLFRIIGRRGLGSSFIADESCNSCSLCAKHCPTKTIVMRGEKKHARPFWRFTCEACNRCINICPKHSIQLSLPFLIIGSIITGMLIAGGVWATRFIEPFYPDTVFLRVLIHAAAVIVVIIIAHIAAFSLFSRAVFALTGILSLRRFFSISHTRSYGRYIEPHFKVSGK